MAIALLQEERGGRASVKSNPLPDPIVAAIWRRASPMRSFFLLLAITTTSRDSYCIFFFLFLLLTWPRLRNGRSLPRLRRFLPFFSSKCSPCPCQVAPHGFHRDECPTITQSSQYGLREHYRAVRHSRFFFFCYFVRHTTDMFLLHDRKCFWGI